METMIVKTSVLPYAATPLGALQGRAASAAGSRLRVVRAFTNRPDSAPSEALPV